MDDADTKQVTARSIKDASMFELEENGHTRYFHYEFFKNTVRELLEHFEKGRI